MSKTGNVVSFQVAKRAAYFNGLATWMQAGDEAASPEPVVVTVDPTKTPVVGARVNFYEFSSHKKHILSYFKNF